MSTGPSETGQPGLDALLEEISEVDFDALREAEFDQIQGILDMMNGKTIRAATIEEKPSSSRRATEIVTSSTGS